MIEAAVPEIAFETLSGGRPVVVLAPHPDDEALGCGALLSHAFAGPGGHVVCMTDGGASHPGSTAWPRDRLVEQRARELDAAVNALGGHAGDVTRLALPDAGMPGLTEVERDRIAQRIADLAERLGAELLVATAASDPHCDHVVTAGIGRRAADLGGMRCLYYPIWSRWTGQVVSGTRYRLPSAAMRPRKASAIAAHHSQHGGLIADDPQGFVLPEDFVSRFLESDEIFVDVPR